MKRLFILFWIIVVSISIYGESVTINRSDKEGVKKGDLYEYRGEKNDVHIYCWLNQYYNPFLGSYTVLSRFYYRFSSDYKRLNCSQEDFDTKYTVDHMYYIDIYELSEPPKETEAPVKMY